MWRAWPLQSRIVSCEFDDVPRRLTLCAHRRSQLASCQTWYTHTPTRQCPTVPTVENYLNSARMALSARHSGADESICPAPRPPASPGLLCSAPGCAAAPAAVLSAASLAVLAGRSLSAFDPQELAGGWADAPQGAGGRRPSMSGRAASTDLGNSTTSSPRHSAESRLLQNARAMEVPCDLSAPRLSGSLVRARGWSYLCQ